MFIFNEEHKPEAVDRDAILVSVRNSGYRSLESISQIETIGKTIYNRTHSLGWELIGKPVLLPERRNVSIH